MQETEWTLIKKNETKRGETNPKIKSDAGNRCEALFN